MDKVFRIEDTIRRMENTPAAELGLYIGVSDDLIKNFERKLGLKLPDDFRKFYTFSNCTVEDSDLFRILPMEEIIENNNDRSRKQGPSEFWFAEYMIYSDVWTVSVDKNNYNNYTICNTAADRIDYTYSLAEFLERYLDGGVYDGIYEWENEIKRNKLS